jgi:hypothetical protein
LWIKRNKIAAEFHVIRKQLFPPKLLSRIQVHVLSIPCFAADIIGLFPGACHRESQLEKHNEVSHHCGSELQERRQLYGEDMQNSTGDDEEHKERSIFSRGAYFRRTRLHLLLIFVSWHVIILGFYNYSI